MRMKYSLAAAAVAVAFGASGALAQVTPGVTTDTSFEFTKVYDETITTEVDNTITVELEKNIKVDKNLRLDGDVTITGAIAVDTSAMSTIDNKQIIDNNTTATADTNAVLIENSVGRDATGNLQFNLTAGHNSAQDNLAAFTSLGGAAAGQADAEIFSVQKTFTNVTTATGTTGASNTTEMLDQVLELASGSIQVNASTGVANAQKNALALATIVGTSTLAEATAGVLQQNALNFTTGTFSNTVTLSGDVLRAAVGNVQVNLAAGNNNSQLNGLAIASATP